MSRGCDLDGKVCIDFRVVNIVDDSYIGCLWEVCVFWFG